MNIERTGELGRRAAKHAALADVGRLRIVDLLSVGDLSPSELQAELDMPSNLLAHHLKVLEGQGFVVRRRSEADRRRSYVQLVSSALDDLVPSALRTAERIVFVCTANSARSQIAAVLWQKSSQIPATSAGTHPAEHIEPGAVHAAARHHLTLGAARPRRITDVVADNDMVITVCDHAHEELAPVQGLHWSVPDPVPVGTDTAFDAAFDDLARRVSDLAPHVMPN